MEFERVGVVGGGLMGSGIAEACARAGSSVVVSELNEESLARAEARIDRSLSRALSASKLNEREAGQVRNRVRFVTDMGELGDRQLVIEAVGEIEELKRSVFAALDSVLAKDAIVATNTSSLPIARLGAMTERPDRFLGLHFFNPVPVMPLVEMIPSLSTSEAVTASAERFVVADLKKKVIRAKDRSGFVVNYLLVPFVLSAIRMVEGGFSSPESVDLGMEAGCAHPLGPLRLADLIGLDTLLLIADALHREYHEPQFVPPQLLARMVESGLLGRKSGRGFYDY